MKKLYLCTDNIKDCRKDTIYKIERNREDTFYVYEINDEDYCILDKCKFEDHFIPLIDMDEVINIFTNKLYGITIRKAKRVTGCGIYGTYHESCEYYIRFIYYPYTMIMIREREIYTDTKHGRECFCCDLVATIHSDLKKIDGLSFVANLIPSEIEDLIKTLEFLCKEDMRYGSEQV